ncbi:MAG: 50S ribosomal protein L21 [Candidatus Moraniibacteriota bacterium]
MFAVIRTGGKQYKVKEGDKLKVEKLNAKEGDKISFDEVLAVYDNEDIKLGNPLVKNAKVEGKLNSQEREKKVITVKQKPKKRYLKKQGHRQEVSEVEITKISA